MRRAIFTLILIMLALLAVTGCGGKSTISNPTQTQGKPIDPSGNWRMNFTDSSGNTFLLSGLFSQTGAVVTGLSFSEIGNGQFASPPTSFNCVAQPDVSMSNGIVQNVSNFTGTLAGNFGTIAFNTTLNDAGTEALGEYTLTPGAAGDCLNIALTGTVKADEIPSMAGTWSGTISCISLCPSGATVGNLTMVLTQDDATGVVAGTYTVTGLPGFSSGTMSQIPPDFLSGPSWQETMQDANGTVREIDGGALNSFGTAGLGTDRSFHGSTGIPNEIPFYHIDMTH